MTKDELHTQLEQVKSKAKDSTILTVSDFISVYGDNQTRMIGQIETDRADVLATAYNLELVKDTDNYTFTRKG